MFSQVALCGSSAGRPPRDGGAIAYDLAIPYAAVGIPVPQAAGATIGFALVVNDDDGGGRKGYLHWGDGIAQDKAP